ncbi:hypothetical protein [Synechococcus sp. HK01-R]|nr:hypothetical protein [Synechococcus sp. HK01-R]QNG27189.1 hypothetical protein H0O21_00520 [Synechococcus sp. HK01-R]
MEHTLAMDVILCRGSQQGSTKVAYARSFCSSGAAAISASSEPSVLA